MMETKENNSFSWKAKNNQRKDKLFVMGGQGAYKHPVLRTGMRMHQPFVVVAGGGARSDLNNVCIMTQWPGIVCKIHRFATSTTQRIRQESSEEKRQEWLHDRMIAWRNSKRANQQHMTVRQYIESIGETYDEEFDEPRLIAKCPGLNIYLELYGMMDDVSLSPTDLGPVRSGYRIDIRGLYYYMQWMSNYMVGFTPVKERTEYATKPDDWQPMDDWHDAYDRQHEHLFIPRACGIGIDYVDQSRREPLGVHHPFDEEEKAEYARLKAEQGNSDTPVPLNELRRQTAANVAARRLMQEMDEQ